MNFRHAKHDIFIPDGSPPDAALERVTHLGIVSHQDDLEIAAYHGITECFHSGNNPLFPPSGPATGSFNGLHPKSKF